jgi:triosephosphate isomerase
MRTPLVAGNWKMNGTTASIGELLQGLKKEIDANQQAEMAVCPPFVYLSQVAAELQGSSIKWGAQNVCDKPDAGAYTGEIAGFMLKELGCQYAIVGHSERRSLYGDSNEKVADRFVAAQSAGLTPIFCMGETLQEREQNITEEIVAKQLDAVINRAGVQALENAVIAYEPVWAIGTGKTASTDQAQQVHGFIRQRLAGHDKTLAESVRILYGGSVNAANASDLFAMPDIDGGLIGGASLKVLDFMTIYRAAG